MLKDPVTFLVSWVCYLLSLEIMRAFNVPFTFRFAALVLAVVGALVTAFGAKR